VINETSLKVSDLSFGYDNKSILKEISLNVRKGKFYGILGPNGSGKSTLLKNVMRYLIPDEGEIYLFNESIKNMNRKSVAKKMGFVPQKSEMSMALTVYETILMGRLPHIKSQWEGYTEKDRRIVNNVINSLGLEEFKDRIALSLSGGEFQKVLLARALVQKPEILLLDEPTSNLDMNHAVELMSLIKMMTKNNGLTAVAVLHDLNLAALFCDEVVFLKNNELKYTGCPKAVFKREIIKDIYGLDVYIAECDEGIPYVIPKCTHMNEEICQRICKCV